MNILFKLCRTKILRLKKYLNELVMTLQVDLICFLFFQINEYYMIESVDHRHTFLFKLQFESLVKVKIEDTG